MRQARIGVANGGGERIHDAFLDAVGEVPGIGDVLKPPPAVGNLLVLGERVGDQGEGAQILAEGRGKRLRRLLAHGPVCVLQPVQRRLQRQFFSADFETEFRHRLVEQAVPCSARRHGFLVEELLDAILKLVWLVLPEIDHPRPVVSEQRVGRQRFLDQRILDQVEFEREKQQMRRRVGHPLLDVAVKLGALRIRGVAGIDQTGIGRYSPDQFLDCLIVAQRDAQCTGGSPVGFRGKLAFPARLEGFCFIAGAIDVSL